MQIESGKLLPERQKLQTEKKIFIVFATVRENNNPVFVKL